MRIAVLGASLLFALPVAAGPAEILRCAAELKQIHPDAFDARIFFVNGIVLGSARVDSGRVILYVSDEKTSLAFALDDRTARLQFEFPHPDPRREGQTHFIHYTHSDVYGSRLMHASADVPPPGRAPSDYRTAKPVPIAESGLRRRLVGLIADQLQRIADLHLRGRLGRADLVAGNLSRCRGLDGGDRAMARWLESQIRELELASAPARPFNRVPAAAK